MIRSRSASFGDFVIAALCILLIVVCLLPMLNLLARSLSDPTALIKGDVALLPKVFDREAGVSKLGIDWLSYSSVLTDKRFVRSLGWTAILTVICTILSLTMTIMCAYPLTYDLRGRKVINTLIITTMYFNAGIIPNYLLLKALGLIGNPLVLIVPNCLSVFNFIILRSFFYGIPQSIRESAELDGAGPIRILTSIYLPLSFPVLATLALFYAVGRWNGFTDALMYMSRNRDFYPIQLLLYNILNNATSVEVAQQEGFATQNSPESIKAAAVMFATVPILIVYPWLQKYFITGVTLGAVKE